MNIRQNGGIMEILERPLTVKFKGNKALLRISSHRHCRKARVKVLAPEKKSKYVEMPVEEPMESSLMMTGCWIIIYCIALGIAFLAVDLDKLGAISRTSGVCTLSAIVICLFANRFGKDTFSH